jgi:hypothetical protein
MQFLEAIRATDDDNLLDAIRRIECADGVRDHRPIAEQRERLVESHSTAAAARDDDRRQHAAAGWLAG